MSFFDRLTGHRITATRRINNAAIDNSPYPQAVKASIEHDMIIEITKLADREKAVDVVWRADRRHHEQVIEAKAYVLNEEQMTELLMAFYDYMEEKHNAND